MENIIDNLAVSCALRDKHLNPSSYIKNENKEEGDVFPLSLADFRFSRVK